MLSAPLINHLESDPFSMQMNYTEDRKTAVFWDYELCPPPNGISGTAFVRRIRDLAYTYSRSIFSFKAYFTSPPAETLRSELRDSNVMVSEEKGSTVDKMRRTVEMLAFAMDQPPSVPGAVIFISSDTDFACVLSELRNKGHLVGLLCPPGTTDAALQGHANDVFPWNTVFGLGGDAKPKDEELINFEAAANEPPASQHSWIRPPPSPTTMLSSSTFSDLLTVQPSVLNRPDPPHQDSGPDSSERTRAESTGPQPNSAPAVSNGQTLHSITIFADLITVLQEVTKSTGVREHAFSQISEKVRERNPNFLKNAKISKFKKYLLVAEEAGIVTNRIPNGEGWVALNDDSMWRVTA